MLAAAQGAGLALPAAIGDWLVELGVLQDGELAAPPTDTYVLNRAATQDFENGVRIARLLQELGASDDGELDTLKQNSAPVAKLYNWNLLLPKLRERGLDIDQDMKVLIVAGDAEIVIDLLEQLHQLGDAPPPPAARAGGAGASSLSGGGGGGGGASGSDAAATIPPPSSAAASTSAAQLLAFCCRQEFGASWGQALHLARNPKQLNRQQAHGAHGARGGFVPIVRWYKLVFAHTKHLAALVAGEASHEAAEATLAAVGGGLGSSETEVALWCSRLLCRLAAELARARCTRRSGRGLPRRAAAARR